MRVQFTKEETLAEVYSKLEGDRALPDMRRQPYEGAVLTFLVPKPSRYRGQS